MADEGYTPGDTDQSRVISALYFSSKTDILKKKNQQVTWFGLVEK